MKLQHLKTIKNASDWVDGRFQRVTAVTWSPDAMRLAVATSNKMVILFDEDGQEKDNFSTKPSDKANPNYMIIDMVFSPDSDKLAVAQTDNIVYVYRLGLTWGEKKSICNKFAVSAPVTCLCWPHGRLNELVFGLANGKLKVGILKMNGVRKNKCTTLFDTNSYTVRVASGPDGQSFISSHLDRSIYRYTFPDLTTQTGQSKSLVATLPFVTSALAYGESIIAASNTGRVQFLDDNGSQKQLFDHNPEGLKAFHCATINSTGHTVVLGNFNSFVVYTFNVTKRRWKYSGINRIENGGSITCGAFKTDGSRVVVGSMVGSVDLYDVCLRRYTYMDRFEITYTSLSSVIVKNLMTDERLSIKSRLGLEIAKISVQDNQFIVGRTGETLLIGDMESTLLSEIPWHSSGKEKFYFDIASVGIIFHASELSVIEYGRNDILGSCRTEYMSSHLVSVRIQPPRGRFGSIKTIAYLLDLQSIRVLDLQTGHELCTTNHDSKVAWLELNELATQLLFMDKRRSLHICDLKTQTRTTLLNFCNYAQWVPQSNVVVAQNRQNLCVWYNVDNTQQATIVSIKGDVETIVRSDGSTLVIVEEGMNRVEYSLNEGLIAFGAAVDTGDYPRATNILEDLGAVTVEVRSMWERLSKIALTENNYKIAYRCYTALGDICKAEYLREMSETNDSYEIEAKMALLNRQYKRAEAIYLQQGRLDKALQMYVDLFKWEESIALAKMRKSPQLPELETLYYEYLMETNRQDKAGLVKEQQGDYFGAITLYLKGGFPARAARVVMQHRVPIDTSLIDEISRLLVRANMFDKTGKFYEHLNRMDDAMTAYIDGNEYKLAITLARKAYPGQVVSLEEQWGDYLVEQNQMISAYHHFIEAGQYVKAIQAAINGHEYQKAGQILDHLDREEAAPFFRSIAEHYRESRRWEMAERYYVKGSFFKDAVLMHMHARNYERAHNVAMTHLPNTDINDLYLEEAQRLEGEGQVEQAGEILIRSGDLDAALLMLKRHQNYNALITLVREHRASQLPEIHLHVANELQEQGNLKAAETHFLEGNSWKLAVQMYKENNMWDDALRVARSHGGLLAYKTMAYAYAVSIGGEGGIDMLTKRGLSDKAVDYAMERGEYQKAFQLAKQHCRDKIQEVHYQFAMSLEEDRKFSKAEHEFIAAKRPKEAIEMYVHQHEWEEALRVAKRYVPDAVGEIYKTRGLAAVENNDIELAESLFVEGGQFALCVKMYQQRRMWADALRIAQRHDPQMMTEIRQAQMDEISSTPAGKSLDFLVSQAQLFKENLQFDEAVATLLRATTSHTGDVDYLCSLWEEAAQLSMEKALTGLPKTISTVAQRLSQVGRFEQAAQYFLEVNRHQDAVDAFLQAGSFDKARQLAQAVAPEYISMIDERHQAHLINSGQIDALQGLNSHAAETVYANRNEWDKVYEISREQGPEAEARHATQHAHDLLASGDGLKAVDVVFEHGVEYGEEHLPLYTDLFNNICNSRQIPSLEVLRKLRQVFMNISQWFETNSESTHSTQELSLMLFVIHVRVIKCECHEASLNELEALQSVALLRYSQRLPVDWIFYEAGTQSREVDRNGMAFVFLNRFVDICDAIDDPDSGDMDNSDFIDTDVPAPYSVVLPTEHLYSEKQREDIREWVLEMAVSADEPQSLGTRVCGHCNAETYEGNLICHNCGTQSTPCIITGYPLASQSVNCRNCQRGALQKWWNVYVGKLGKCPWCLEQQTPIY